MVTYFTDTFTGTNGAAWSANWTSAVSGTGASATIQTNKGRMNAGTNSAGNRIQRYSGSTLTDVELSGKIIFNSSSTAGFVEMWIRGNDATNAGNGYFLSIRVGSKPTLNKGAGFTYPNISTLTTAPTVAASTEYGFKFYAVGTSVKAKFWATSGAEPSSYDTSVTDSTHTAAGQIWVNCSNGSGTTGYNVDLDDVQLTDGSGAVLTFTGSCQPSGVLTKSLARRFTGSISAIGTFLQTRVVVRVFTGSITATGALIKRISKTFTGSSTPTGVFIKTMRKTFTGSSTPTGVYRKAFVRIFTGTITTQGNLITTALGRVFGKPGVAAMRVYRKGEAFLRARRN